MRLKDRDLKSLLNRVLYVPSVPSWVAYPRALVPSWVRKKSRGFKKKSRGSKKNSRESKKNSRGSKKNSRDSNDFSWVQKNTLVGQNNSLLLIKILDGKEIREVFLNKYWENVLLCTLVICENLRETIFCEDNAQRKLHRNTPK